MRLLVQELCRLHNLPEPPDLEMLSLAHSPAGVPFLPSSSSSPSAFRPISSANEGLSFIFSFNTTSCSTHVLNVDSGGGYASSSGRGSSGSGSACSSSPAREEDVDGVRQNDPEEDDDEDDEEMDDADEDLQMEMEDEPADSASGESI